MILNIASAHHHYAGKNLHGTLLLTLCLHIHLQIRCTLTGKFLLCPSSEIFDIRLAPSLSKGLLSQLLRSFFCCKMANICSTGLSTCCSLIVVGRGLDGGVSSVLPLGLCWNIDHFRPILPPLSVGEDHIIQEWWLPVVCTAPISIQQHNNYWSLGNL
jgi:hypothetical protein